MRQHAQLDLAVIRVNEDAAVAWHEHPADLAAKLRADGDILKVRICRGQAARGCDKVLEGGVNAPVVRDLLDKPVGIRAFELCHGTVIENRLNDWVLALELFEHIRVCRIAALRLLACGQSQLVKQDLTKLLRGIDIEFAPGEIENGLLGRFNAALQHISKRDQGHLVSLDARIFHLGQYPAERQLDLIIELFHAVLRKLFRQRLIQCRDRRRLRKPIAHPCSLFADLVLVRAADLKAEQMRDHAVKVVASLCRVEIVGGQRSIENEALRWVSKLQQAAHERLTVVRDLLDGHAEQG